MPEEVVVAEDELKSADDSTDLESGFSGTPTENTPPAEEKTDSAAAAPEVKYRQVTEAEWEASQAASVQFKDELAKVRDTAFGKVGGLERALKELQQATPKGYEVDITDDIVADLRTEFPEIGDLTLKALKSFAGKLKGTAPAAGVDPAQFGEQVTAEVTTRLRAIQAEALDDDYPTWREIVGSKDSDTPYRKWLATQPAEYHQKVISTDSASIIGKSIAKFEAAAKTAAEPATPKPAPSTRQQRLEAAVVTKGIGGAAPGPTDEDEFNAGFKSG